MDKANQDPELLAINQEYEQQLSVERYILNLLSEEEASEFESFFLSNQECLDQLEIAERLYEGLQTTAGQSSVLLPTQKTFNENKPTAANDESGNWWKKTLNIPAWAAAAMLLIVLAPTMLFQSQVSQDNPTIAPTNSISVINLPFAQRRGEVQDVITLDFKQQSILAMYIDTELSELVFPVYQFQLSNKHGENQLLYGDLKLASDDMLYVNLGSQFLLPGTYDYSIKGQKSGEEPFVLAEGKIQVN